MSANLRFSKDFSLRHKPSGGNDHCHSERSEESAFGFFEVTAKAWTLPADSSQLLWNRFSRKAFQQ
jgi:hypothetical protein